VTVGAIVAGQSPRVYTTGNRRGDEHLFNRATNWGLSPRRSPRRSLWPVAATIAPCIRPIIYLHR